MNITVPAGQALCWTLNIRRDHTSKVPSGPPTNRLPVPAGDDLRQRSPLWQEGPVGCHRLLSMSQLSSLFAWMLQACADFLYPNLLLQGCEPPEAPGSRGLHLSSPQQKNQFQSGTGHLQTLSPLFT